MQSLNNIGIIVPRDNPLLALNQGIDPFETYQIHLLYPLNIPIWGDAGNTLI